MSPRFTARRVVREIGADHLELVQPHRDYWIFIFDDGDRYETTTIYTPRLSDLPLESWVNLGRDFLKEINE